ncbi:uncharacterized protein LOC129778856 [Toxorhynchites rutilus septentrionalis]|uniref:uncharacterized protein LOC129778856 n=1 Tax=Toxorhynchites rutilus septentrionalis TaxID=329112 RepID=UPI00247A334C|nr:uncharacterized protein LOC129778856 [Toxorhynchites rutilus septentrionalis]
MAPAFKKPASRPVKMIQQDIGVLVENIRSRVQSTAKRPAEGQNSKCTKKVRFESDTPDSNTNQPQPHERLTPADNPYAREIFMCKTNVRDIAKGVVESQQKYDPLKKEQMIKGFRDKLYRFYANEPKYRIRDPLHRLRFESCYYEYRFYLALNKPLDSEEEYQEYLAQLTDAGVSECWVRMKDRNLLLKHEEAVVAQVRTKIGTNWSGKLEKLDTYLMDSQRRYEKRHRLISEKTKYVSRSSATSVEDNQLLENIMNHSNANRRFSSRQIMQVFPDIKHELEQAEVVIFSWLLFDDDELNKRYKLGNYGRQVATASVDRVIISSGTSDGERSLDSECSEFRQMRSEMAMTQPSEILPMEGSYFANTAEVISVLDPMKNLPEEVINLVDVQSLEQPVLENNLSAETESSALLTPAQQEVILITDSPSRSPIDSANQSNVKEGDIFYSLDYLRNFTNVRAVVIDGLRRRFKGQQLENKMTQIDKYIARYHDRNQEVLSQNKLPEGLRLLTRKERMENRTKATANRPAIAEEPGVENQAKPTEVNHAIPEKQRVENIESANVDKRSNAEQEKRPSVSPVVRSLGHEFEARVNIPHVDTPIVRTVTVRARTIQYEEDESFVQAPQVPDSMPMPDTENFMPSDCSTQIPFGEFEIPPSAIPFPSPNKSNFGCAIAPHSPILSTGCNVSSQSPQWQPPPLPRRASVLSKSSAGDPAYDSDVSNVTVVSNKNAKSPTKSPRIKVELNTTSYEGEVEFVPLVNRTIEIEDSMEASSQIDANELIERHAQRGAAEDSVMFGVPAVLQGMVNALFQENRDTTLSQGSSSNDSDSRQGTVETAPGTQEPNVVGFRNHTATPRRRSAT